MIERQPDTTRNISTVTDGVTETTIESENMERLRELPFYKERVTDRDRQYTLAQRTSNQFQNIDLNKQIMRISDTSEICDFSSAHDTEFNHVNVSTDFHKVLKETWRGIPQSSKIRFTDSHKHWTREESVLKNMEDFGSQRITNTLHIILNQRHKLTKRKVLFY